MNYPNRNGRFSGVVTRSGFVDSKNHAVMYHVDVAIDWEYSPRDEANPWVDVASEDMSCPIDIVVVTTKGELNESGIRQLKEVFGFDGDWNKMRSTDFTNHAVQIQVKGETYNDQLRYKGSWLYPADATPGELINEVDDQQFGALATRYGAQTRALISGNGPKPGGRPAPPTGPRPAPNGPTANQGPPDGRPPFDAHKAAGAANAPPAAPRRGRPARGAPAAVQTDEMPPATEEQAPWGGPAHG